MRVTSVQNNTSFKALQIRNQGCFYYKASELSRCKEKLANTKFVDVIIDSHGMAIKDKKTDVLQRIQSFSLFPQENSVSVNMIGEKNPKYKFFYLSLAKAKEEWNNLRLGTRQDSSLVCYTKVALWLEELLAKVSN